MRVSHPSRLGRIGHCCGAMSLSADSSPSVSAGAFRQDGSLVLHDFCGSLGLCRNLFPAGICDTLGLQRSFRPLDLFGRLLRNPIVAAGGCRLRQSGGIDGLDSDSCAGSAVSAASVTYSCVRSAAASASPMIDCESSPPSETYSVSSASSSSLADDLGLPPRRRSTLPYTYPCRGSCGYLRP